MPDSALPLLAALSSGYPIIIIIKGSHTTTIKHTIVYISYEHAHALRASADTDIGIGAPSWRKRLDRDPRTAPPSLSALDLSLASVCVWPHSDPNRLDRDLLVEYIYTGFIEACRKLIQGLHRGYR